MSERDQALNTLSPLLSIACQPNLKHPKCVSICFFKRSPLYALLSRADNMRCCLSYLSKGLKNDSLSIKSF